MSLGRDTARPQERRAGCSRFGGCPRFGGYPRFTGHWRSSRLLAPYLTVTVPVIDGWIEQ
jgi:hypothetical protein